MRLKNEMTEETNSHKVSRSLWLIWKHPDTGRYARIGQLDSLNNGDFVFSYESAEKLPKEFAPLAEFPDIQREYTGPGLPAFYANRVMSESRSAYGQYIDWLGVDPAVQNVPLEILARTGGERATDTFHIVERPLSNEAYSTYFFVSGLRHTGFDVSRGTVSAGEELQIVPEPENPHNSQAVLLASGSNEKIGWIPDWLLAVLSSDDNGSGFRVNVEKVNVDAPPRLQLLCSVTWGR